MAERKIFTLQIEKASERDVDTSRNLQFRRVVCESCRAHSAVSNKNLR